ncbi:MAG: rhomboid family intramembrane serine protease [Pseudomonadota bacterium]
MILRKDTRIVFRRLLALLAFMVAIWGVQALNDITGYGLNILFGLIPRHVAGIDGVIGMPFLHGSYDHLISNTPPLLLMGGLLALTATRALIAVNGVIVLLGGALVWLFGETAIHVGASGLIFGWFGFLVARGVVDRSPITLATSLLIVVLYGSIVWGMVPGQTGISWEAHLFGALSGVAAAVFIKSHIHAPRLRNVDQR